MRIAILNSVKPHAGSGAGVTEYAYQLYSQLKKKNKVDLIYAIDELKRDDVSGLAYTFSLFKKKLMNLDTDKYDIIHIANHEIGFAAKIFKKTGTKAKIVTTIHDITRLKAGMHRGVLQSVYNKLVLDSVRDAIKYSDYLLFDSDLTMNDIKKMFDVKIPCKRVSLGVKSAVLKAPIRKKPSKNFIVGYVGSFAYHKNVMLLLKVAKRMKDERGYKFVIYGTGIERKNLTKYKNEHQLSNVELKGFASEQKLPQIYDSFDVFVFPSLYEGFGLPILEAEVRGLPVITYKPGKVSTEIKKYSIEAKDAENMSAIIKMLKKKGYNAKQRSASVMYARSFTWEKCAKAVMGVYKRLIL